jgi:hypothetical protein
VLDYAAEACYQPIITPVSLVPLSPFFCLEYFAYWLIRQWRSLVLHVLVIFATNTLTNPVISIALLSSLLCWGPPFYWLVPPVETAHWGLS